MQTLVGRRAPDFSAKAVREALVRKGLLPEE